MSLNYNQFRCPLCGKSNSTSKYDPSDFEADIIGINKVGAGYARGFRITAEGSILDSEEPFMVKLKARIATLYDLLYEDDSVEEFLDEINSALDTNYETLLEASKILFSRFMDYREEEQDEMDETPQHIHQPITQELDVEDDWDEEEPEITEEPLNELDREILIGEHEEP